MATIPFRKGWLSPQPGVEKTVVEQAVPTRTATIAAPKGEKIDRGTALKRMELDQGVGILGGLPV